jgi:hypothetical protein
MAEPSALAAVRSTVNQELTAGGLTSYAHPEEVVDLPCAFVGPGDPYLEFDGAAFGACLVNTVVVVVAEAGDNQAQADQVDALILQALAALEAADRDVAGVDSPGRVALQGGSYLGAVIRLVPTEVRF